MSGCRAVTGDIKVFGGCRSLKEVNLYTCQSVVGDLDVFSECPDLRLLNLFFSPEGGNERTKLKGSLGALTKNCRNLRELNLFRYVRFSYGVEL